jgi:hypothetical protein
MFINVKKKLFVKNILNFQKIVLFLKLIQIFRVKPPNILIDLLESLIFNTTRKTMESEEAR